MTSSQWLDIAIVAVGFVAAVSGWRSGALGSLMSLVGVILGAVAGVLLAPHLVNSIDGARMKLFATLFLILALVVIGEIAGVVVGRAVRGAIRNRGLRTIDSTVGVAVQLVLVLAATWLLATPLLSSGQPNMEAAVKGSKVVDFADKLAPDWLRGVPKRLSALWDTSGMPAVLEPFGRSPIAEVDPPDPELVGNLHVELARPAVVKIRASSPGCQKVLEGTGFVFGPHRVMSNAHVVAGSDSVTVVSNGVEYDATVVSYDPTADISILSVPTLDVEPLEFNDDQAKQGTDAIVLGYPGGGEFQATPARISEVIELNGPDIYRQTSVTRQVYTIRGPVKQGNSGGPLIDTNGRVLGVVFGAAVDDVDTGFVLTAQEVQRQRDKVGNSERVPTGSCVT